MQKLSEAGETFLNQLHGLRKGEYLKIPQHLWPILERCDTYIKDHIQEIVNELETKGYIEGTQNGFKLTDDGYKYLWREYTDGIVCPHCGKVI